MQARISPNGCRVAIQDHEGVEHRVLIFEDAAGSTVSVGPFTPGGWEKLLDGLNDPADAAARSDAAARIVVPGFGSVAPPSGPVAH